MNFSLDLRNVRQDTCEYLYENGQMNTDPSDFVWHNNHGQVIGHVLPILTRKESKVLCFRFGLMGNSYRILQAKGMRYSLTSGEFAEIALPFLLHKIAIFGMYSQLLRRHLRMVESAVQKNR